MKKEIIIIDKKKGVYRITTPDSRFYLKEIRDLITGLPIFSWKPSVTWISGYYPKGIAFYKYLASKGWDESQVIMEAAGVKGTKVHSATSVIIAGGIVKMEDKFINPNTNLEEELTVEEYECLMSFVNWANDVKPKFILNEITVESEKYNYAGTVDCIVKIGEQVYLIDFKTGQYIWPEHELQIAAYKQALKEMGHKVDDIKLALLQIGYRKNKKGYKFTEIEDKFNLFLHAKAIWANECEGQSPKQAEYPLELKIASTSVEKTKTTNISTEPVETSPTPPNTSKKGIIKVKSLNKLTK